MRDADVQTAADEARRFLARVEEREAQAEDIKNSEHGRWLKARLAWVTGPSDVDPQTVRHHACSKECPIGIESFNAAVKRASMDLSRALVKVRR